MIKQTLWLVLTIIILSNLAMLASAENDPGHDTLYIEQTGDSELTGMFNVSENFTVKGGNAFLKDNLDIFFNGITPDLTNRNVISGSATDLYLDAKSSGNIYLNAFNNGGNIYVGGAGDTVNLNVTGALYVGGLDYSATKVCLANGSHCPAAISGANLTANSATSGYIVQFQNASVLNNSVIYQSGSNIGIGTTSPNVTLHVNGSINVTTGYDVCIEDGTCLSTVSGGDASERTLNATTNLLNTTIQTAATNISAINTTVTTLATNTSAINDTRKAGDDALNVTIVQINGNLTQAASNISALNTSKGGTGNCAEGTLVQNTTTTGVECAAAGGADEVGTLTNTYVCYTDGDAVLCDDAGMTFTAATNTITAGNITVTTNITTGNLSVTTLITAGALNCTDCIDGADLADTVELDAILAINGYNVTFNTSVLHVDVTNGRVGVGTAAPGYALEVVGSGTTVINLKDSADSVETIISAQADKGRIGTRSNHDLNIVTNNVAKMIIAKSGYVSINTTSPDATLAVAGNLSVTGTTNSSIDSGTLFIDATNNKVGVGTAAPDSLLDVQSSNIATQLRVSYDDTYYSNISADATGNLTIKAVNHVIIDLS
ncbi:hypothetical protein JW756_04735 [Candidatus Woesearchaeota archaeon]|nr:hypothetical protein [Candidatus Woesearchaeota archaeon]